MRILQFCLSDGHGGLELYVCRLAVQLRARGIDCRAMAAPGTRLAERLDERAVPAAVFTRPRITSLPLMAARRLARLLEAQEIDIVHLHWSRDLPLVALAKRLCRRSLHVVYTRHMNITRPKGDPYHRFLYRSLDRLVVLSDFMHRDATRYLPMDATAIETIHTGVAAPRDRDSADDSPVSRGNDTHALSIALFGRIEPPKGQYLLIEAVDLLRQSGIRVQAHIIGHAMDDAYLDTLKADVSRRGLDDQVEFAGFHPDPQGIMADFDVIVLATHCDTFPLVLMEAMRCGVAVVGSDAGGVPEIIEHETSGLLFTTKSASSLAEQLGRLAKDPDFRKRLARGARERGDRLFSETRHVEQIAQLYEVISGVSTRQG